VREFYAPRRNVNGPVAGPNPTTFPVAPILSPTQLQATASRKWQKEDRSE